MYYINLFCLERLAYSEKSLISNELKEREEIEDSLSSSATGGGLRKRLSNPVITSKAV